MNKERIFLVGFMGAGKSTIGRLLAARLDWSFLDLDQEIERAHRKSIQKIFEDHGETYFRQLETEALQNLKQRVHCVVALGGGAFVEEINRRLVGALGYSVFLDCPLEIILDRCPTDGTRPLFQSRARVRELYQARLPYYRSSDFRIEVSSWSPEKITDFIFSIHSQLEAVS